MREFTIKENDADQRLDRFVFKVCKEMPKNLMYKYIRNKKIKVNRARCTNDQRLKVNDTVQMYISEDFFEDACNMDFMQCEPLKQIVYEDDQILVVHKPAGLLMHSDISNDINTLQNQLLRYLFETKQYDPRTELSFTPACVNRLDRNTEGLVLACKTSKAARVMSEKIRNHEIEKHYLCIVSGKTAKSKRLKHYYLKDEQKNMAKVSDKPFESSVSVELVYTTIKQNKQYSLCDIHLITGKSHQIRVQMAYEQHPLIGDKKYGGALIRKAGQALCAYKLIFHFEDTSDFAYLNNKEIISNFTQLDKEFEQYR